MRLSSYVNPFCLQISSVFARYGTGSLVQVFQDLPRSVYLGHRAVSCKRTRTTSEQQTSRQGSLQRWGYTIGCWRAPSRPVRVMVLWSVGGGGTSQRFPLSLDVGVVKEKTERQEVRTWERRDGDQKERRRRHLPPFLPLPDRQKERHNGQDFILSRLSSKSLTYELLQYPILLRTRGNGSTILRVPESVGHRVEGPGSRPSGESFRRDHGKGTVTITRLTIIAESLLSGFDSSP